MPGDPLNDPLEELLRALADLRKARDATAAWSDDGRHDFDEQYLDPLAKAGTRFASAIRRTQDEFTSARREIASDAADAPG